MKKFFSLVLALVMALSLTTVAWGADLSANVTVDPSTAGTYDYNTPANTGSDKVAYKLADGATFDGGNYTVTFNAIGSKDAAFVLLGDATIKNVKVVGATRGIESGAVVPATTIAIDNVVVEDCVRAIHINTAATANLNVSNSTFEGKISFDLQGGTATFTNCTFKYDSTLATGKGNIMDTYDSVIFENCVFDEGYMVNVFDLQAPSATLGATYELNNCIYAGEPLTADNLYDLVVNIEDYNGPNHHVHAVPSGYVATPVYTATGTTAVDTKDAKTMAVKGAMVIEMVPAKAAYINVAGDFVPGYVKHYVDEYGVTYVPCTSDVEGALYLYYKGTTSVYDIVVAADPDYVTYATEYTNFGTACGQYNNIADFAGTKYYTFVDGDDNTIIVKADNSATPYAQVLVGDKLVGVGAYDYAADLNAHKWVVEKNAKNEITKAACSLCGINATWVRNLAAVPTTGVDYEPAPGGGYLYWSVAPVATTPSTDKVTSAETFDAGIAMYVGMSVMAAAGAVVLKKKD